MKKAFSLSLLVAAFWLPHGHAQEEGAKNPAIWTHQSSDLKPDDKVVWGSLENGVRYAILPNVEPPNKASLRLYIDTGSLMEDDDQRGLAHFLEHMAFNGTTHFPAGEMVEYFQRLGMAFGADTNAHTWWDETVYKLELPNTEDKVLLDSFRLFRDFADGMLLGEEEIEKERGIILSEKLTRESVQFMAYRDQLAFSYPKSLIPNRITIGTEEVIKAAPREAFVRYYDSYYSPERIVIIAVGNVDPEKIAAMTKAHFGTLKAKNAQPNPDLGTVENTGLRARLYSKMEAPQTVIQMQYTKPHEKAPDTAEKRNRKMLTKLAHNIINRRLEILKRKEGAPFTSAQTAHQTRLDFADESIVRIACDPAKWKESLALADQELRRALEHGFTEAEVKEQVNGQIARMETAARQQATRKSDKLASAIVRSVSDNKVFTMPANELIRTKPILDAVTSEQLHEHLKKVWDLNELTVHVSGNLELDGDDASKQILETLETSRSVAVEAPVETEMVPFAYTKFGDGTPGKMSQDHHVEDLDLHQIIYENNVRLNLKKTDFEDDTIYVSLRVGGGKLTAPKDNPGLIFFVDQTLTTGGLEAHSADELKTLLAGKTLSYQFSVGGEAFKFVGKTNQRDFLDQVQLLAAALIAQGYREEAQIQFRRSIPMFYSHMNTTPEGIAQLHTTRFLAKGDFRFGMPSQEDAMARTLEEAKAWLDPELKNGFLEVTVVGDIDMEATKAACAATFGALPERLAEQPDRGHASTVHFPKSTTKAWSYESEIPKAISMAVWPTDDRWDVKLSRRLSMVSQVFSERLRIKVREDLGESYSPHAYNMGSSAFDDYGFLQASVTGTPEQAEMIADLLVSIATDVQENGTNDDELQRLRQPMLSRLEKSNRTNGYWSNTVLSGSSEHPEQLDWARTRTKDYETMSLEEVNETAKKYLDATKAVKIIIKNAEKE